MKARVVVLGYRDSEVMGRLYADVFISSAPPDCQYSGYIAAAWKVRSDRVLAVRAALAGCCPALVDLDVLSRATSSGAPVQEVLGAVVVAPVLSLRGADGTVGFEYGEHDEAAAVESRIAV